MNLVAFSMDLLLAGLLFAALVMGLRLNRRLKGLKDSHDSFAVAVRELNAAAERAEQGLADLRAATDEATDVLADRIEKGRALAAKLERLVTEAPKRMPVAAAAASEPAPDERERRLGMLLAAAREARSKPEPVRAAESRPVAPLRGLARPRPDFEDDLFDDEPLRMTPGARR